MKNFVLGIVLTICSSSLFADKNSCVSKIVGYKVVKNTVFPFVINKEKACFFAFYTKNPEPRVDAQGNGNIGDSIWYAYYKISKATKIYEFPKPLGNGWSSVCSIDAISFYAMHGDHLPDVTVIGSCNKNAINYTIPFVFLRHGDEYILDEKVYSGIYGLIGLTVADVRAYIKSPETYYKVLEERSKLNWQE